MLLSNRPPFDRKNNLQLGELLPRPCTATANRPGYLYNNRLTQISKFSKYRAPPWYAITRLLDKHIYTYIPGVSTILKQSIKEFRALNPFIYIA